MYNQIPSIAKFHIGKRRVTMYVNNEKVTSKSYVYDEKTYPKVLCELLACWIKKCFDLPHKGHKMTYLYAVEVVSGHGYGLIHAYQETKNNATVDYYVIVDKKRGFDE